jgi:hypothetical protein
VESTKASPTVAFVFAFLSVNPARESASPRVEQIAPQPKIPIRCNKAQNGIISRNCNPNNPKHFQQTQKAHFPIRLPLFLVEQFRSSIQPGTTPRNRPP